MAKDHDIEYEYTPLIHNVGDVEQLYCEKLGAWWDEVQQRRKEKQGVVQHIGDEPLPSTPTGSGFGQPQRRWQLIQDARLHPMKFFDCTIEVRRC